MKQWTWSGMTSSAINSHPRPAATEAMISCNTIRTSPVNQRRRRFGHQTRW